MTRTLVAATIIAVVSFLGFTWAAEALTGSQLPQVSNYGVYTFFGMIGFIVSTLMVD